MILLHLRILPSDVVPVLVLVLVLDVKVEGDVQLIYGGDGWSNQVCERTLFPLTVSTSITISMGIFKTQTMAKRPWTMKLEQHIEGDWVDATDMIHKRIVCLCNFLKYILPLPLNP